MRRTLAQIAGIPATRHYREGGHVRGPGTGTSDSINAKLSDGEFVLPNDTVRKVGVRRLQDLVHMTHTPSGNAPQPGHYADGGWASLDQFNQKMGEDRAASRQRALGAARAAQAENDAAAQAAESAVSQIPTGGLAAPPADDSQDRWSNTETGRNLSNMASALPGSLGGAIPAIAKTGGAISGGIDAATRLLNAGAGAAAISAIPGAASAQSQAFPPSPAGAGRGMVNPASVNPALPPPAAPPRTLAGIAGLTEPTNDVTRTGNSYSGSNVSGDITINGQAPGNGGAISPQNMAAADNLAAGQGQNARARLLAAGGAAVPGVVAPQALNSSNSWQARNNLRNAEVSASSIMNRAEWSRSGKADAEGKIAAFNTAKANDAAMGAAQPALDQAAMRENAGLQREGLQQAGETERTGIRAEGVNAANQISSGRLKLEQIAAGYTNRSADRLDRAQAELEGAKTPEAQKSARERLMALAGRAPQNEWGVQVTPSTKNADGSSTQGSVYRYNKATGETVRVDQPASAQPPANHAAALRANPKLAAQFDEMYGKGAAASALGGR